MNPINVTSIIMLPAASVVPPAPLTTQGSQQSPIQTTGEWFRVLASSPFVQLDGAAGSIAAQTLPIVPTVGKVFPCFIRRGRYPVRVRINGHARLITGPGWRRCPKGSRFEFWGCDASDAAMAAIAGKVAGYDGGGAPFVFSPAHSPGIAYQYVLESTDEPEADEVLSGSDELGAVSSLTSETVLTAAAGSGQLIDYKLARCFDRHAVLIENNGPNPILVWTAGDADLFYRGGIASQAGQASDNGAKIIQPGDSIQEPTPWGISWWARSTVADQVAGAACDVTEF